MAIRVSPTFPPIYSRWSEGLFFGRGRKTGNMCSGVNKTAFAVSDKCQYLVGPANSRREAWSLLPICLQVRAVRECSISKWEEPHLQWKPLTEIVAMLWTFCKINASWWDYLCKVYPLGVLRNQAKFECCYMLIITYCNCKWYICKLSLCSPVKSY